MSDDRPIRVHITDMNKAQSAEDDYFRASETESAETPLYKSLMLKLPYLLTFDDMRRRYDLPIEGRVLELGGGYGWLSAYMKCAFPDITMVYSDVSVEAVKKSHQYEELFGSTIDEKWVTSAEDTPFPNGSCDTVVFFASFHHVQDPDAALRECARILKPGGHLLLLLEPACPAFMKPLYDRHVHRDLIEEKHYTLGEYKRLLAGVGLTFQRHNYRSPLNRRSKNGTLYYAGLSMMPAFLLWAFPCSQVIIGTKPK
jgi:SAM-dependent methyltransferase